MKLLVGKLYLFLVGCQFQVTISETISISYLVHTCNQTSNEWTGRLRGGLAIGISLPESVRNIPSLLWLGRQTLKEDNISIKFTLLTIDGGWDEFFW